MKIKTTLWVILFAAIALMFAASPPLKADDYRAQLIGTWDKMDQAVTITFNADGTYTDSHSGFGKWTIYNNTVRVNDKSSPERGV